MNLAILRRNLKLVSVIGVVFLISVVLAGCSPISSPPPDIEEGSSKGEVIALLGEPDQTQDFELPGVPFFGPQEGLANLVPAGTMIEEWVYEIGEQVLYVWFTGQSGESQEDWLVIDTAMHPKDAVY